MNMQKSQPGARFSSDENQIYAQGYSAGFEAGQLANLEKGPQQKSTRSNGQPLSSATGNQRPPIQGKRDITPVRKADMKTVETRPIQEKIPIKSGRLSNGFQSQKPFDKPTTTTRDVRIQEHEMNGRITNPETEVQFMTRGHY